MYMMVSILKINACMRPENQSKYTDRMAGIPTSRMGMLPRISPSAPGSQPSSAELATARAA